MFMFIYKCSIIVYTGIRNTAFRRVYLEKGVGAISKSSTHIMPFVDLLIHCFL